MTLLIYKISPFDSQMTLLIYKTRRFMNPGVTSDLRWSARPNILLSERNNMTARDRESVPWEVVSLLCIDLVLVRSSYWFKGKRYMTRAYDKNMVSISLCCRQSKRPRFCDSSGSKASYFHWSSPTTLHKQAVHKQPATRGILLREFDYYSLLLCTTVRFTNGL